MSQKPEGTDWRDRWIRAVIFPRGSSVAGWSSVLLGVVYFLVFARAQDPAFQVINRMVGASFFLFGLSIILASRWTRAATAARVVALVVLLAAAALFASSLGR